MSDGASGNIDGGLPSPQETGATFAAQPEKKWGKRLLTYLASRIGRDSTAKLVDVSHLATPEERIAARSYHDLDRHAVDLYSRLQEQISASAEPIDFGTTALDIGSRDGRYTQVIRELGVEKVTAIDPLAAELQKGVDHGLLAPSEVFPDTLEEYVAKGRPQVDSVFVFNIDPDLPLSRSFIDALVGVVKPGGLVVTSCIERDTNIKLAAATYWAEKVLLIKKKGKKENRDRERYKLETDQGDGINHFLSIGRRAENP